MNFNFVTLQYLRNRFSGAPPFVWPINFTNLQIFPVVGLDAQGTPIPCPIKKSIIIDTIPGVAAFGKVKAVRRTIQKFTTSSGLYGVHYTYVPPDHAVSWGDGMFTFSREEADMVLVANQRWMVTLTREQTEAVLHEAQCINEGRMLAADLLRLRQRQRKPNTTTTRRSL